MMHLLTNTSFLNSTSIFILYYTSFPLLFSCFNAAVYSGSNSMGPVTNSHTCYGQKNIPFQIVSTSRGQYEFRIQGSSMHMQRFNVAGYNFSEGKIF